MPPTVADTANRIAVLEMLFVVVASISFMGNAMSASAATKLTVSVPAARKADTNVTTYRNPVWNGYFADPAVLKDGDVYYAFGTGDVVDGKRFPVLRSTDLTNWQLVGGALTPLADAKKTDYWAPEPAKANGKYYLYYSAGGPDGLDHQLRVATAEKAEGPYIDAGKTLIPSEPFSIDAHPFRDDDGRWYLFFVKDFLDVERPGTGIAVVELNSDMVSIASAPQTILTPSADWQIFGRNREWYGRKWPAWYCIEGPYVVKRDGKYVCFYSGGCWETPGYGVAYAVADKVTGPYADAGTTRGACVLRGTDKMFGPGHNSITVAPDDKTDVVVYHAWDKAHTARRLCVDPLVWDKGMPTCDGPSADSRSLLRKHELVETR